MASETTDNELKQKGQKGVNTMQELREGHFNRCPLLFLVQKPSAFSFFSSITKSTATTYSTNIFTNKKQNLIITRKKK